MSGGTMCKVRVGRTGGASGNALYITRERAVKDKAQGVFTRHLEEGIAGQNFAELRTNISSYFWAREEIEIKMTPEGRSTGKATALGSGAGAVKERKTRTNYRVILGFEREVGTDKAKAMVDEWLSLTPFRNAPAVVALHRDTEHLHAHVLVDARCVDGKKIDLSPRQYHTLDEVWNKIYCRELGLDEQAHLAKKGETRAYKRAVAEAKRKGEQAPERPGRANFPARDVFNKRDERADQSVTQDEVLNASRRFDRSVKQVECWIKKQFNPQPASGRQLEVLTELESRLEKLRRSEETLSQRGRDGYHADEGRTAVRESDSQGRRGAVEKEGSSDARVVRLETSAGQAVGNADRRGADRERTGGGRSRALTGIDESI